MTQRPRSSRRRIWLASKIAGALVGGGGLEVAQAERELLDAVAFGDGGVELPRDAHELVGGGAGDVEPDEWERVLAVMHEVASEQAGPNALLELVETLANRGIRSPLLSALGESLAVPAPEHVPLQAVPMRQLSRAERNAKKRARREQRKGASR